MNATFLHDDNSLPSDQLVDVPAPECPDCGQRMWLIRFTRQASDEGLRDVRSYACRACGASKIMSAQPSTI
jgi:hypothetical protein